MRAIFLLFDSLNRAALGAYGGTAIPTPNFDRLARRSVVFDNHFVGSLPCMPARRELHTGRLNFTLRSWGPLEPFDNSFAAILRQRSVYTHLISDHYHYFEDGGLTYHTRYSSWEYVRGQEGDRWRAMVEPPLERLREKYHRNQFESDRENFRYQALINREYVREEADYPSVQCFDRTLEFLETNRHADNWLLHVETFDPHEPFAAPARFRARFPTAYTGPVLDWPRYREVNETAEETAELRANYAALVSMCDEQLGRLLDYMDKHGMWSDTALVLTTDHGFLLGEHDLWGKSRMPCYNEIAHIPLCIHLPRMESRDGVHRSCLTQTMDVMPTLLRLFDAPVPSEVRGCSLLSACEAVVTGRDIALYGMFGGAINITDGRYTYFRYPVVEAGQALYEYTLMPTHMHDFFTERELAGAEMVRPFDFTRGMPVLKVPALSDAKRPPIQGGGFLDTRTVLYDLWNDPGQQSPIGARQEEARLAAMAMRELERHDSPREVYERFGLMHMT